MTVVLDGRSLTLEDVVAVSRQRTTVDLAPAAVDRMRRSRLILEQSAARGEPIYGFTTGVGALKRVALEPADVQRFNRMMVLNCRLGQGSPVHQDVVRATLLRLANNLARAVVGVRQVIVHPGASMNSERQHGLARVARALRELCRAIPRRVAVAPERRL